MTLVRSPRNISQMKSTSDHERLFDEICGKLAELSQKHRGPTQQAHLDLQHGSQHDSEDEMATAGWSERLEKMQNQIKKSQDELMSAQESLQNKIGNLENLSVHDNDLSTEVSRLSGQLEQERQTNSKLNGDLAKALELNLKLQFEIEEIRAKANQILAEEKKHNQYLLEKNKSLSHELELSQALCQDTRLELGKARDKFQMDQTQWSSERTTLTAMTNELRELAERRQADVDALSADLKFKEEEIEKFSESLSQFEAHSQQQQGLIKGLSDVAEKKIIELKVGWDKKTAEAQDYYSHLQQALSQVSILRQENQALKEYIGKLTALHQNAQNAQAAQTVSVNH